MPRLGTIFAFPLTYSYFRPDGLEASDAAFCPVVRGRAEIDSDIQRSLRET
jgi:hypothetical protein